MSQSASHFRQHRTGLTLVLITLVMYAILAVVRHSDHLIWDEGRYLGCAKNLTQGFYVTDSDPDFVNGPGYPIVLVPFVSSPAGWLAARILNAFFMAGAVGFVWLTVRHYAGSRWAAVGAALVAFHPTLVWMGFTLMTEPLAMFCITGFVWSFCLAMRTPGWRWPVLSAVFLGWLTLTRVFFGHVIMATAALCLALLLLKDWRPQVRRALLILAGAFLICVPYLANTHAKTGQTLCWSTNSGELIYWMTSHHAGENGHWFSTEDAQEHRDVAPLHDEFYEAVLKKPVMEREAIFKATARANFQANPAHVFYNWVCNLSRLAFGFPRSHQPEELRTITLVAINGPVILLAALAGLLGLWRWRTLPPEIWLLMGFTAFYLGGSTLAPALPRYFVIALPILWLGIATVCHRHVRVSVAPCPSDAP